MHSIQHNILWPRRLGWWVNIQPPGLVCPLFRRQRGEGASPPPSPHPVGGSGKEGAPSQDGHRGIDTCMKSIQSDINQANDSSLIQGISQAARHRVLAPRGQVQLLHPLPPAIWPALSFPSSLPPGSVAEITGTICRVQMQKPRQRPWTTLWRRGGSIPSPGSTPQEAGRRTA